MVLPFITDLVPLNRYRSLKVLMPACKLTSRQASRYEAGSLTDRQDDKLSRRYTNRPAGMHPSRHTPRQACTQAGRHRKAGKRASRQAGRQVGRQTGRKIAQHVVSKC